MLTPHINKHGVVITQQQRSISSSPQTPKASVYNHIRSINKKGVKDRVLTSFLKK